MKLWKFNHKFHGKSTKKKLEKHILVCLIEKKVTFFYGRTEFDSPDVDNDVLVDAREHYIKIGEFIPIKIHEAGDFDLYGTPLK